MEDWKSSAQGVIAQALQQLAAFPPENIDGAHEVSAAIAETLASVQDCGAASPLRGNEHHDAITRVRSAVLDAEQAWQHYLNATGSEERADSQLEYVHKVDDVRKAVARLYGIIAREAKVVRGPRGNTR